MNNNLKHYTEQPDPEVWNSIQRTLKHNKIRRQVVTGAIGAAVTAIAIIAVINWPSPSLTATSSQADNVAMVQSQQPAVNAEAIAPAAVPTTEPAAAATKAEPTHNTAAPTVTPSPMETAPIVSTTPSSTAPTVSAASTPTVHAEATPASATQAVASPTIAPTLAHNESEAPATTASTPAPAAKPAVKAPITSTTQDTILWIPNAFIPGSDDAEVTLFRPRINKPGESISNYRLAVYNRAGHQVFFSNDINYGWDGTYKGVALPQASYVYVIYYTDKDRIQHQRKGTVTLIR